MRTCCQYERAPAAIIDRVARHTTLTTAAGSLSEAGALTVDYGVAAEQPNVELARWSASRSETELLLLLTSHINDDDGREDIRQAGVDLDDVPEDYFSRSAQSCHHTDER